MKVLCAMLLTAGILPAAEVHVYVVENVAPVVVLPARAQTSWMFNRIGVGIRWHEGEPPRTAPAGEIAIRISFSTRTPLRAHPGALAYAEPFIDGVAGITVLYDRVRFVTERQPGFEPKLLAHVLAHEIGHILAVTNHHSPDGVMKAHWTPDDYAKMAKAPLPFAELDRRLIADRVLAAAR